MSTVLLIIQLIISLILTGLILIQRSEGGALGIGGGGGGGLMSGRSATNSIARMTWILGAVFIVNCLALSVVFNMENQNTSLIDDTNAVAPLTAPVESPDTTNPLAAETSSAETPTLEATPEVAEEPKTDE
ncbi:preprotein translocase subunit SecG [Hellea balneolensis]|uniref:preprotein translocase subunit SecG n=1 Tax=Hellea balneolensis TaxID=287478 RepID=UPI0004034421|nr:preprotein translocase subunit SecG [Hellea balneolensis]